MNEGLRVEAFLDELAELEVEATAATNTLASIQERAGWTPEQEAGLRDALRVADGAAQLASAAAERRNARKQEEQRIREILKHDGACPTCGGALNKERKVMLEAEVARLGREGSEAHADFLREKETEKQHREKAAELERQSSGARSVAAQVRVLETTINRWKTATEKGVPARPNLPELRANHARVSRIHEARVAYDASVASMGRSGEKLEALRGHLATFEKICAIVSPDGVGDEEGVLGFINGQVTGYAASLFPGRPPPALGADWEVSILGRPACLASDSERLRAGLCFAIALAVGAGPGIVIFDRGESLEPSHLMEATSLLARLAERGEIQTALITRVQANATRPASLPQGVKWFHVHEGTAQEV